jgi:uncharacterized protein
MGLVRLIIIIALVWLIWRLVKATLARTGSALPARRDDSSGERMLRCAQCGVHVPTSTSFRHGGQAFCSQAHQREYLEENHD